MNMWNYSGKTRPDFAEAPAPGQESVWDYPRPPALVDYDRHVVVKAHDTVIADSARCKRVLETASPPTIYIPPDDIDFDRLSPSPGSSFCEWKGAARYWALAGSSGPAVGWSYPNPTPAFITIADWLCFYPGRVECYIDRERVRPQEGGFYGGWVTDSIAGPWKGMPGTSHW
jgi:uncharacterized protein (DUF427 family)